MCAPFVTYRRKSDCCVPTTARLIFVQRYDFNRGAQLRVSFVEYLYLSVGVGEIFVAGCNSTLEGTFVFSLFVAKDKKSRDRRYTHTPMMKSFVATLLITAAAAFTPQQQKVSVSTTSLAAYTNELGAQPPVSFENIPIGWSLFCLFFFGDFSGVTSNCLSTKCDNNTLVDCWVIFQCRSLLDDSLYMLV